MSLHVSSVRTFLQKGELGATLCLYKLMQAGAGCQLLRLSSQKGFFQTSFSRFDIRLLLCSNVKLVNVLQNCNAYQVCIILARPLHLQELHACVRIRCNSFTEHLLSCLS